MKKPGFYKQAAYVSFAAILILVSVGCSPDENNEQYEASPVPTDAQCVETLQNPVSDIRDSDSRFEYFIISGRSDFQPNVAPSIQLIETIITATYVLGDHVMVVWTTTGPFQDSVFLDAKSTPYPEETILATNTPVPTDTVEAQIAALSPTSDMVFAQRKTQQAETSVAGTLEVRATQKSCEQINAVNTVTASQDAYARKRQLAIHNTINTMLTHLQEGSNSPPHDRNGSYLLQSLGTGVQATLNECLAEEGCVPKMVVFSDFTDALPKDLGAINFKGEEIYLVIWGCRYLYDTDLGSCASHVRSWKDLIERANGRVHVYSGDKNQNDMVVEIRR